ncbi:hypothetical protein [Algibacillus agarilyticus]|uniref:hypothetical protein n=1 Tax=Algibacillus agarilyticus TaxID=2234133 RepID=UPI000DD0DD80|nr:hypothetical protein [Algibacillus agarilyticus]
MKKSSLVSSALILLVSSFAALAESTPAPAKELADVVAQCKAWAAEDEIEANELKAYLLTCVNDELENLGYDRVKSI